MEKDNFGPYTRIGFPDSRYHLGVLPTYIEVKKEGEKPRKIQIHELKRHQDLGYAAFCVAGHEQVAQLTDTLLDVFSEESVEQYIKQYRADAKKLREGLAHEWLG